MILAYLAGIGMFEMIIIFIPMILWLWALIDVLRSNFSDGTTKLIWLIVVIFIPFLGSVLYLALGRKQHA
jgi:hypothetical protein